MLKKVCCDCAQPFEVEEAKAWATRCLPCWIAQQDRQGKRRVELLQAEVDYWRSLALCGQNNNNAESLDALQRKIDRLEFDNLQLRMELMTAKAKARKPGKSLPQDWKDQLPRLIQLAHPDRHGNSEAANAATVWLLGLKKSIR